MTKSQQKVEATKAEVNRLWRLACLHDGIGTTSQFVVFSDDNPLAIEYNAATVAYQAAVKAEKANKARRDRHAAMTSMGLKRVKGALGGVYYE